MAAPGTVADRLALVRARIERAGGDPGGVRVLAVTKGFGPDAVDAALAVGLTDVGENYADELLAKAGARGAGSEGPGRPVWHYLGAVQRRKVPRLAPVVDCWQGVARAVEGEAIARRRPGACVMVQVETTQLPRRHGAQAEDVPGLVASLSGDGLRVLGLMTVAPLDPAAARESFRTVRALADRLGLPVRSMGMTDDLELAVAEGSTMVRVGRALFGDRPAPGGRAGFDADDAGPRSS
ncbi:MAG TPA: YggS family pyridoxal phosphate enzyme [Acidimicrobiales bacterium]|nr:YggS family pyridoxal phosphate enzyme [Acidimicrobiales bacterium]